MIFLHRQNTRLVIFDFDGTIADTSEGILDSHIFALKTMGRDVPPEAVLRNIIGGNLLSIYVNTFGFSELEAREAVKIYRRRYSEVGIHLAVLYPGFSGLLKYLKKNDYSVGIATLKSETFAKKMIDEMCISPYFDYVCGMDENDSFDKAGLIRRCMNLAELSTKDTVLIGDTNNDYRGAETVGISFIGVTYGFGLKKNIPYDFLTVDSPWEIIEKHLL